MYTTWLEVRESQQIHGLLDCKLTRPSSDNGYRQTSYISRTFERNKIIDHSDVVGASPVGAAPTTDSFST